MLTQNTPLTVLEDWKTILGEKVELGDISPGRDLWPVTAEDGARYFLKRLSPWRNLPLADEARILMHLAWQGVRVAEFLPTDRATLYAAEAEDSFILIPRLANDHFDVVELVSLEEKIGGALAELHLALARYPWPANSYTETLGESLEREQELMLPPDVAEGFARRRDSMTAALTDLPTQLIHGDLTPENVLLRRPAAVSGFIDFDHLPLGPRIWDIAKYLSRRIRLRWRQGSQASDLGRLDHLAGFLIGYHKTNPLGAAEIEALPSGIAAGNVLEVSYLQEISAGTLSRRKLPDHDAVLADTVEAARWHLANHEEVAAAVRSNFA
jgi:Ser/Thr protein kinase RdoA (MazF antagonist)